NEAEIDDAQETQKYQKLKKFGRAMLTASAYTVQALYVGKEQLRSHSQGATASTMSVVSKYSEILSPKLDDLAYRRGGENRWRRLSRAALKVASVGLAKTAPKAGEVANNYMDKYEKSTRNTEYNTGGGRIVR